MVEKMQEIKRQLAVRTYILVLKVTKKMLRLKTGSFVPEKKKKIITIIKDRNNCIFSPFVFCHLPIQNACNVSMGFVYGTCIQHTPSSTQFS